MQQGEKHSVFMTRATQGNGGIVPLYYVGLSNYCGVKSALVLMPLKRKFTEQNLYQPAWRRLVVAGCGLLVIACNQLAVAQSPSIEFRAERGYVFDNPVTGLLPFVIVIANPTAAP